MRIRTQFGEYAIGMASLIGANKAREFISTIVGALLALALISLPAQAGSIVAWGDVSNPMVTNAPTGTDF
jgi:hypothetical protein